MSPNPTEIDFIKIVRWRPDCQGRLLCRRWPGIPSGIIDVVINREERTLSNRAARSWAKQAEAVRHRGP